MVMASYSGIEKMASTQTLLFAYHMENIPEVSRYFVFV